MNWRYNLSDPDRQAYVDQLIEEAKARQVPPHELRWKDGPIYVPVIEVPLDWVYFNMANGRTRAQQAIKAREKNNPNLFSDVTDRIAQQAQAEILRELDPPSYRKLLENLRVEGQRTPGVMTRAGVLLDGNRRGSALLELGAQYLRVAVLPGLPAVRDLQEWEWDNQIAEDFKEEYTPINRLLVIDQMMNDERYTPEMRAAILRQKQSDILIDWGILALMREYVATTKGLILLGNLEGKYESFYDAYKAVNQAFNEGDQDRAERIKTARFLGILADTQYRHLRSVREDFAEAYVQPALEKSPMLQGVLETLFTSSERGKDTGILAAWDTGAEDLNRVLLGRVVDLALEQVNSPEARVVRGNGSIPSPIVTGIKAAIRDAALISEQDDDDVEKRARPLKLIDEATRKIRAISLAEAVSSGGFSTSAFQSALEAHEQALEELRTAFARLRGDNNGTEH